MADEFPSNNVTYHLSLPLIWADKFFKENEGLIAGQSRNAAAKHTRFYSAYREFDTTMRLYLEGPVTDESRFRVHKQLGEALGRFYAAGTDWVEALPMEEDTRGKTLAECKEAFVQSKGALESLGAKVELPVGGNALGDLAFRA